LNNASAVVVAMDIRKQDGTTEDDSNYYITNVFGHATRTTASQ